MPNRTPKTEKSVVVSSWNNTKKYWMANEEYAGVAVGKDSTDGEYVITTGVIEPAGFVPDHYHKWEDQTFHVIEGVLDAKIGNEHFELNPGDSIHCPRGVTHYMKNIGSSKAKVISYIFPGEWAEDFMAETSRQNQTGQLDLELIEKQYGVVYV